MDFEKLKRVPSAGCCPVRRPRGDHLLNLEKSGRGGGRGAVPARHQVSPCTHGTRGGREEGKGVSLREMKSLWMIYHLAIWHCLSNRDGREPFQEVSALANIFVM